MIALASLFIVIVVSLIVTRVATIALTLTGLSREAARFQARSAFSGAGFTTGESEAVVNHPVRRRIVMLLILLGGAGVVSAIASLLLSFTAVDSTGDGFRRVGLLIGGLLLVWRLATSRLADRALTRVTERALRRFTTLNVHDYASLLHFSENWVVGELYVEDHDWLADQTLVELDLPSEGVVVLGIERSDGRWVAAPKGTARIHVGDVLVVYGHRDTLRELDDRMAGPQGDQAREESQERFADEFARQQAEEHEAEEEALDHQR